MKKRILFALIDNRHELLKSFVVSLIGMYDYTKKYHKVDIINVDGNFIDQMRNTAVEHAIQGDYDYIYFIDTDQIYPKDSVIRLLSHDKDIIGGLYYRRRQPHLPCHFKSFKNMGDEKSAEYFEENELKKVKASGFGGVLIKTEILKKLKFPYFETKYVKRKGLKGLIGEDIDFCMKVYGKYDFWIDPTIKYGHIGLMAIYGQTTVKELH